MSISVPTEQTRMSGWRRGVWEASWLKRWGDLPVEKTRKESDWNWDFQSLLNWWSFTCSLSLWSTCGEVMREGERGEKGRDL